MKQFSISLVGIILAGLTAVSVGALPASALTYSEQTIDGVLPTNPTFNCSADAVTMKSTYLKDKWGSNVGFLELRYSVTCHAAWARLTNYYTHVAYDTHSATAKIKRLSSPSNNLAEYTCSTPPGTFQSCYTAMVFDLDPRYARASAVIDAYDSYYGEITGQTATY